MAMFLYLINRIHTAFQLIVSVFSFSVIYMIILKQSLFLSLKNLLNNGLSRNLQRLIYKSHISPQFQRYLLE